MPNTEKIQWLQDNKDNIKFIGVGEHTYNGPPMICIEVGDWEIANTFPEKNSCGVIETNYER